MATFVRIKSSSVIYMHHHIDGERFKVSTGVKVDADKWSVANNKPTNSQIMYKTINVSAHLKQCEFYLHMALRDLTELGGGMPELMNFYRQREAGKRTIKPTGTDFMSYFYDYYKKLEAEGKSTYLSYQTTYRRLEKYFGKKKPTFSEINIQFYEDFGKWLETSGGLSESNDVGLSKNTISGQWKNIKNIMNRTLGKQHNSTDFKSFERHEERSDNIALTQEEVDQISNVKLTGHLDKVRDYFLLQCYTGVRFSDIDKVNSSNIKDGFLTYTADKTDEECIVPIRPQAKAILAKYKGKLPPVMSNQKYNDYIKLIGQEAKITDPFNSRITVGGKKVKSGKMRWQEMSSHTGRRTFATLCVEASVPVHLIMQMTGHLTLDNFDKYVKLKQLQGKMALGKLKYFK